MWVCFVCVNLSLYWLLSQICERFWAKTRFLNVIRQSQSILSSWLVATYVRVTLVTFHTTSIVFFFLNIIYTCLNACTFIMHSKKFVWWQIKNRLLWYLGSITHEHKFLCFRSNYIQMAVKLYNKSLYSTHITWTWFFVPFSALTHLR